MEGSSINKWGDSCIDYTTQSMLMNLSYYSSDESKFKTVLDMFVIILRISRDEDVDFDELLLCAKEQMVFHDMLASRT